MKHLKSFSAWLNEVGTGSNAVAVVPTMLFTAPVRRKKIKEEFQLQPLSKVGYSPGLNSNEVIPVQTKPKLNKPDEFKVADYHGSNTAIFALALEKFNESRSNKLKNAIITAINGDDQFLINLYNDRQI